MAQKSRDKKEYSENQKLKYENQKLKRQISKLRRELNKIDVDRYQHLKDLVEAQRKEDVQLECKSKRQLLKEKWQCFECQEGYLRLMIFHRLDGIFYYRRCTRCGKKTKMQKYHDQVEGIKD